MSSFTAPEADLQPVDWGKISDAIFAWIIGQNVVGDENITWQNQDLGQPSYPYIDLLIPTVVEEGGPPETRNNTLDANGNVLAPGDVAAPVENEEASTQPNAFTLTIRAFVDEENGATNPNQNAMKLLSKLRASLGLRSVIDAFFAEGVSIIEPLALLDLSEIVNSDWQSRATLDVSFRTAAVITEKVGFIDKVGLESTDLGVSITVDASN